MERDYKQDLETLRDLMKLDLEDLQYHIDKNMMPNKRDKPFMEGRLYEAKNVIKWIERRLLNATTRSD